jgi:hypothetical protein
MSDSQNWWLDRGFTPFDAETKQMLAEAVERCENLRPADDDQAAAGAPSHAQRTDPAHSTGRRTEH